MTPRRGGSSRRDHRVFLGEFLFESDGGRLSRRGDHLTLRPKTAAVLASLVAHAGEVVTKQELLRTVWPDGFVGDGVLAVCVNELRRAFGDDSREPHVIETVHRVGYRLLVEPSDEPLRPPGGHRIVGRAAELTTLGSWWEEARREGTVRVGLVAAQAGGGKTALLDEFATRCQGVADALVGWGQCVEGVGAGEPYLPLLETLGSLCRGPHADRVVEVLRRCAPSWLVQLPGVLDESAAAGLERSLPRSSPQRMLAEFAAAVERLSDLHPLLLVVEDLHDADRPTVELIGYLARRRARAGFLVLGSYRPAEVIVRAHRLRSVIQDLAARGLCRRLTLESMSAADVGAYAAAWFAPRIPAPDLVTDIAERTEGNPLFVVALCRHLDDGGLLVADEEVVRATGRLGALGVPDEVRIMLQRRIDALDEVDRRVLAVAAAVGDEFTVEAVSAGLAGELPVVEVEERCAALAREGSLLRAMDPVEWPDGTVTGRFRLTHQMYRDVLYETLGPARRVQVHRAVGARLAEAYGPHTEQIAAELATHHERGRDDEAAVRQLATAARVAMIRSAYPEAHEHVRHALSLLERIPVGPARARLELRLRRTSVVAVAAVWGWQDPDAVTDCLRLRDLATELDDVPALVTALLGLHNVALVRSDRVARAEWAAEVMRLADRTGEPTARLIAHLLQCYVSSRTGDCGAMWAHAERILELVPGGAQPELAVVLGEDPALAAHQLGAVALWQLGHPDQARDHVSQALSEARALDIPTDIARALWYAAVIHTLRGEARRVADLAAELEAVCVEHDLRLWRAGGRVLGGWATTVLGDPDAGLARLSDGLTDWARFARLGTTFHACVAAAAHLAVGDLDGGLTAVTSGLDAVATDGEHQSEPELLRLHAELLRLAGDTARAEDELCRALELTAERSARGFRLRVATSLAGMWELQGRAAAAAELLGDALGSFAEGHDTRDLRDAAALLERLSGVPTS